MVDGFDEVALCCRLSGKRCLINTGIVLIDMLAQIKDHQTDRADHDQSRYDIQPAKTAFPDRQCDLPDHIFIIFEVFQLIQKITVVFFVKIIRILRIRFCGIILFQKTFVQIFVCQKCFPKRLQRRQLVGCRCCDIFRCFLTGNAFILI